MSKKLNIIKELYSKHVNVSNEDFIVKILTGTNGYVQIERTALRSKIKNHVDTYTHISSNHEETIRPLDIQIAEMIIGKLTTGNIKWSDAFIVSNMSGAIMPWKKSESEHKYTSTGIKFWRHPDQMKAFKSNQSKTIISTHISPEGACNLKCPYCSVTYRDTHNRIELDRIKEYVTILKNYGLRAVILTGGGEPTLYRQFNELVLWLKAQDLSIGLITNGTQTDKISKAVIKCFSWVRVSVNIFDGWQEKIRFPYHDVSDDCVIGCSMVYTGEHEKSQNDQHDWLDLFRHVSSVADNCGATYVRVLPNCLLEQNQLLIQHEMLNKIIGEIGDSRFFQQYKIHKTPGISTCNQAYFRPYLSEESWHGDGTAGTVYPCDSVVLNQATAHFSKKFQICKPEDIGAFLEKRLNMNFEPKEACSGCVFADNVEMLEEWKHGTVDRFHEFPDPLKHEEFV